MRFIKYCHYGKETRESAQDFAYLRSTWMPFEGFRYKMKFECLLTTTEYYLLVVTVLKYLLRSE